MYNFFVFVGKGGYRDCVACRSGMGVRYWDTWLGSCMFVPFRGARSKGIGFDGTSW